MNFSKILGLASLALTTTITHAATLNIDNASDFGSGHASYPASKTIDGSLAWSSRWAASGSPVHLVLDLGSVQSVTDVGISWGRGASRTYSFEIWARASTSDSWTKVRAKGNTTGNTSSIESYDIDDINAQYVRIKTHSNSAGTDWTDIKEVEIYGGASSGGNDLDSGAAPSENFDLSSWYLSVPTDTDNSGTADSISEADLNKGYEDQYFYTGSDGGMVFMCYNDGYKTSTNTSYTRSELREMLRNGDTSISTSGVNKNNWVFSSAPSDQQSRAGGVDGNMKATLAVNHVTSTGDSSQQGRVIIGQIHAASDEPIRLYYRLLDGHSKGSIYFAHEPSNGNAEQWYEMIGSKSSSASEPSDGIALDEVFGYEIDVKGDTLTVKITREGKSTITETVDMSNSGYDGYYVNSDGDTKEDYMYFKAGVYNQNKTGDDSDYVQATFYSLEQTHD